MKRAGQLCLRVAGDCHRSLVRSAAPALGQQTGRALAVDGHNWQAVERQSGPNTFAALAVSRSSWHSSASGFSSTAASLQHVAPSDSDSTVTPADPKASPPEAEDPLAAVGEQPAESPAAAPQDSEDDWLPGRPAAEVVPEVRLMHLIGTVLLSESCGSTIVWSLGSVSCLHVCANEPWCHVCNTFILVIVLGICMLGSAGLSHAKGLQKHLKACLNFLWAGQWHRHCSLH